MTALVFILLARAGGSTLPDTLRDIRAAARPGDHVAVIGDSGLADSAPAAEGPRLRRFLAEEGWPPGVTASHLITGAGGSGDLGVAVNLALDLIAPPGAAPDPAHLMFLGAGSRLDAQGIATARALAADHDLVLLPWRRWDLDHGRPEPGPEDWANADPMAVAPVLQGMLAARDLVMDLHADAGRASHGALSLEWRIPARARRIAISPADPGWRPAAPDPGPDLLAAARDLLAREPAARPWLARRAARDLARLPAGARGALITAATQNKSLSQETETGFLDDLLSGDRARIAASLPRAPAPVPIGRARIRIWRAGRHAHLSPFGHAHLAPLWADTAVPAESAEAADLILWAHPEDPATDPAAATPGRHALFSEEPFWDMIFGPDPLARQIRVPGAGDMLALHQVNHHRSPVFAFDRIPYFPLTRPDYARRYAALFARNAAREPADWTATAHAHRLVFMAERRPEPHHDRAWPAGDIIGLCAWRTRLAEAMEGPGIRRIGASWGDGPARLALADWHEDKLARLDGATLALSALENTHQPDYISEKIFDAFACGAIPLYMAGPGHRLHDLGLPEGSWINLWGLDSDTATAAVTTALARGAPPGGWDDFVAAQAVLARLWTDAAAISAEYDRLGRALATELGRLMDLPPA